MQIRSKSQSVIPCPNQPQLKSISSSIHQMQTRLKTSSGNSMEAFIYVVLQSHDLVEAEPGDIYSAIKSPHQANVVQDEMTALAVNNTWCFTSLPGGRICVGCKCLFKNKRNHDGPIARYKACFVAIVFSQKPGFDFQDTFSPVVKASIVYIILTFP